MNSAEDVCLSKHKGKLVEGGLFYAGWMRLCVLLARIHLAVLNQAGIWKFSINDQKHLFFFLQAFAETAGAKRKTDQNWGQERQNATAATDLDVFKFKMTI